MIREVGHHRRDFGRWHHRTLMNSVCRPGAKALRQTALVLVVFAAVQYPPLSTLNRLRHEYKLRHELESGVKPHESVRDGGVPHERITIGVAAEHSNEPEIACISGARSVGLMIFGDLVRKGEAVP
jgi:hypothetical protein